MKTQKINTQNNKGFTLIELIIVTIILGILAAVAIPRYTASVARAEAAAENAVISSIRAGLETYATEQLMDHGRRMWTQNPFDALESNLTGYSPTDGIALVDGEWTYNIDEGIELDWGFGAYHGNITHMRRDNTVKTWHYNNGNMTSGFEAVGSLGS
mgnify:FL=1